MKTKFEQWMKSYERKQNSTAYQYAVSIDKISRHYSSYSNKKIDLYSIHELNILESISDEYLKGGRFSEFGGNGNGTIRNAIATYVRYMKFTKIGKVESDFTSLDTNPYDNNFDSHYAESEIEDESLNFSYERDLQSSLISEIPHLFREYKIFGSNREGVEYSIGGKRIDVLLEHRDKNELLAIELKAGKADFKVFGQISMYIGLLSDRFSDKNIKGVIIAGSIDETLINACLITDKVSLKTYSMKLELENA